MSEPFRLLRILLFVLLVGYAVFLLAVHFDPHHLRTEKCVYLPKNDSTLCTFKGKP